MNELRIGKYRHYKGGMYKVIGVAIHTETGEELVIYTALTKQGGEVGLWARPKSMFIEVVSVEGKSIPRFKFVE